MTALEDGGFAFSWSRKLGAGNEDIYISVYNADGSVRQAPRAINVNPEKASYPSMAGLADGGFVVAWEQEARQAGSTARFASVASTPSAIRSTERMPPVC